MTTVQIIGVSVAGAAILLLIIALVVTRRGEDEQDEVRGVPSFLDEGPQDTFAALGKAEQPVEDITLDPSLERALAAERAAAERAAAAARAEEVRQPQPGGLGLDWGPDLSVRELEPDPVAAPSWTDETEITGELRTADETEITGRLRVEEPLAGRYVSPSTAPEADGDQLPAAPSPAPPDEGGPTTGHQPASDPGPKSQLVPLSDIIVTTSGKMVDLLDPEVRRMLTELVTFEVDQAADFRRGGQTIDAVLQLTEAEKVSRALGMSEAAEGIRAMIREINEQE